MTINYGILNTELPQQVSNAFMPNVQKQMNELALQKAIRDNQDELSMRNAFMQSGGDNQQIVKNLQNAGLGKQAMTVQQQLTEQQKTQIAIAGEKLKLMKQLSGVVVSDPSVETATRAFQQYQQMTGDDVSAELARVQSMSPDQIKQYAIANSAEVDKLLPQFQHFDSGGSTILGTYTPATGQFSQTGQVVKTITPGEQLTDKRTRELNQDNIDSREKIAEINNPQVSLSDTAMNDAADKYNMGQGLPNLGMGKNATNAKISILERASQKNSEAGIDSYTANLNRIASKSDASSLTALTKAADSIGSFDQNFKGALALVRPLVEKINNGEYPTINKVSNLMSYQGGDPNIKAAKMQLLTAMMDYQKLVTAGSNISNAELSVGAQKRAEELLSLGDNLQTFDNATNVMLQDASIKAKSIIDARDTAAARLKGRAAGNNSNKTPSVPAGATHGGINPNTGQMEYFDANGNKL